MRRKEKNKAKKKNEEERTSLSFGHCWVTSTQDLLDINSLSKYKSDKVIQSEFV